MDINTNTGYWIARDPDMALSSNSDWVLPMTPGGGSGHSQQVTPLHPGISSIISLQILKVPHISFSSIYPPLLTHRNGSCCRQATRLMGAWLTFSHKWVLQPTSVMCLRAGLWVTWGSAGLCWSSSSYAAVPGFDLI